MSRTTLIIAMFIGNVQFNQADVEPVDPKH